MVECSCEVVPSTTGEPFAEAVELVSPNPEDPCFRTPSVQLFGEPEKPGGRYAVARESHRFLTRFDSAKRERSWADPVRIDEDHTFCPGHVLGLLDLEVVVPADLDICLGLGRRFCRKVRRGPSGCRACLDVLPFDCRRIIREMRELFKNSARVPVNEQEHRHWILTN